MTLTNFAAAKAIAHFENNWETCPHKECKHRKTCTGGPRGTFRKTNGKPFCQTINLPQKAVYQPLPSMILSNSDFLKD